MKRLFAPILMLLAIAGLAMAQTTLFHFDGTAFQEGASTGVTSISAVDGYLPLPKMKRHRLNRQNCRLAAVASPCSAMCSSPAEN